MKNPIMYAEVTTYGTACSETALCLDCFNPENKQKIAKHRRPDVVIDSWTDCTGNEALSCMICGKGFCEDSPEYV